MNDWNATAVQNKHSVTVADVDFSRAKLFERLVGYGIRGDLFSGLCNSFPIVYAPNQSWYGIIRGRKFDQWCVIQGSGICLVMFVIYTVSQ